MSKRIFQLATAGTVTGVEMVEASQPSTTVTVTASTISSAASDNSLNDSGGGLLVAGFTAGKTVYLSGFTGGQSAGFGVVDSVTANKMILTGITLVDDSAGESVTITQWDSVHIDAQDIADLGVSDASAVTYTPVAAADWDGSVDPGNVDAALDQLAERVTDVETGGVGGTAGRHSVPVMAGGMLPSISGGAGAHSGVVSGSNMPDIWYLSFPDAADRYAQFAIPMPKKWDEGTITFKPIWSHPSTATNFTVVWSLQAVAIGDDDTIAASYGTAQTSTDTGGTTDDLYVGPESSAITIAGTPAAEDVVFFRVARLGTDGSDNLAVDARLHGIILYYTTNAETDA